MKEIIYIFIGGGVGSVLRYLLSKNLNLMYQIPVGTFLVNVLGSFLLGIVLGYIIKNQSLGPLVLLFTVGFCGGFTTFSAFAVENFTYLKNGDYQLFLLYSLGSLGLTILAVYLGFIFIKAVSL